MKVAGVVRNVAAAFVELLMRYYITVLRNKGALMSNKLTDKQEKFCRYIVAGCSQTDAYRLAYNTPRAKPETIIREASRLRKNLKIIMRIEELQAGVRAEEVTNIGRELRKTLEMRDGALGASNYTAVASLQRLILQAIGAMQHHVSLSMERSLSDDELIKRLASGDSERLAAAKVLLGAGDGFPDPGETRH